MNKVLILEKISAVFYQFDLTNFDLKYVLMNETMCLRKLMVLLLLAVAKASLIVPASMLSPFNIPDVMGPESVRAVKLAIGARLIDALGSLGIGSAGTLATSLLVPPMQAARLLTRRNQMNRLQYEESPRVTPRNTNFSKRRGPNIPTTFNIREATPTEIENFFGVLHRVDANKCISRLVCEVGANPKIIEGLGHNVKEIIGSLRALERNSLSNEYRNILLSGQKRGFSSCSRSFPTCDDKAYRMVRTFVRAFRFKN